MNTRQRTSGCRVISIASASSARAQNLLAMIPGQNAMNLAELAESIRADHHLCDVVTEAAFREFGWPRLRVEDAIVLLGGKRLRTLVSAPVPRGLATPKLRRTFHSNSITPSADLCLLEMFQGELE